MYFTQVLVVPTLSLIDLHGLQVNFPWVRGMERQEREWGVSCTLTDSCSIPWISSHSNEFLQFLIYLKFVWDTVLFLTVICDDIWFLSGTDLITTTRHLRDLHKPIYSPSTIMYYFYWTRLMNDVTYCRSCMVRYNPTMTVEFIVCLSQRDFILYK